MMLETSLVVFALAFVYWLGSLRTKSFIRRANLNPISYSQRAQLHRKTETKLFLAKLIIAWLALCLFVIWGQIH